MSVDPANPAVLPTSVPPTTPVESDLDPDAGDEEDAADNEALEEKVIEERIVRDDQPDARPEDWNEPPASARPEDWNEPPASGMPDANVPTPLSDERR